MPGLKEITKREFVRAKFVMCEFTAEDEDAIALGRGNWPEGYTPTSVLKIQYRSDNNIINSGLIEVTGTEAAAAIREFFVNLSEGHKLVRKVLDGTLDDTVLGIKGSDHARTKLAGVEMDFHDGSGVFIVKSPDDE